MKFYKLCITVLTLGAATLLISACQKKDDMPKTAEAVGQQIDQTAQNVKEQTLVATDKVQDSVKDGTSEAGKKFSEVMANAKEEAKDLAQKAGEKIESAGQKIQEVAKDAQK